MSLYVYVEGQREDVERFYNEVIYPNLGRLRENERFRVTENKMQYEERNKTTHTVERKLRGYSPTLKYRNRPGLWEPYVVEIEDIEQQQKKTGKNFEKVKGVQVKIYLRSMDPSEVKLFYDEIIKTKGDLFTVEKDTGFYINWRNYAARVIGGHFNDPEE